MPQNQVTYNGFAFPHTKMTVESIALYDDAGIAQVGVSYLFRFVGVVSATTTTAFAALVNSMNCALYVPRKALLIQWAEEGGGSWDTLYQFDNKSGSDVSWGPHPGELHFERISGGRSAIYTWSVRVESKQCFSGSCVAVGRGSEILALTRTYLHQVDPNGFTTRTVSGRLVVTSGSVQNNRSADALRKYIVDSIPLPINFVRQGQNFEQSPDGRVLSYSITDAEKMWTLPRPISSGRATWMTRVSDYGARIDYVLSGEFSAPASVTKSTMVAAVQSLIISRFPIGVGGVTLVFEARELKESIYDNTISFNITAWSAGGTSSGTGTGGGTAGPYGFYAGLSTFGARPPDYDGHAQWIGAYGGDGATLNSGVIAAIPYLYDACDGGSAQSAKSTVDSDNSSYGDGKTPVTNTPLPSGNTGTSKDHFSSPYQAYKETISWEVDNKIATFSPKLPGIATIVQQTAAPVCTVIQAGYAIRVGAQPVVPPPVFIDPVAAMLTAYIEPESGDPVGNSLLDRFTVRWRFVLRLITKDPTTPSLMIKYPDDPRREKDNGPKLKTEALIIEDYAP